MLKRQIPGLPVLTCWDGPIASFGTYRLIRASQTWQVKNLDEDQDQDWEQNHEQSPNSNSYLSKCPERRHFSPMGSSAPSKHCLSITELMMNTWHVDHMTDEHVTDFLFLSGTLTDELCSTVSALVAAVIMWHAHKKMFPSPHSDWTSSRKTMD